MEILTQQQLNNWINEQLKNNKSKAKIVEDIIFENSNIDGSIRNIERCVKQLKSVFESFELVLDNSKGNNQAVAILHSLKKAGDIKNFTSENKKDEVIAKFESQDDYNVAVTKMGEFIKKDSGEVNENAEVKINITNLDDMIARFPCLKNSELIQDLPYFFHKGGEIIATSGNGKMVSLDCIKVILAPLGEIEKLINVDIEKSGINPLVTISEDVSEKYFMVIAEELKELFNTEMTVDSKNSFTLQNCKQYQSQIENYFSQKQITAEISSNGTDVKVVMVTTLNENQIDGTASPENVAAPYQGFPGGATQILNASDGGTPQKLTPSNFLVGKEYELGNKKFIFLKKGLCTYDGITPKYFFKTEDGNTVDMYADQLKGMVGLNGTSTVPDLNESLKLKAKNSVFAKFGRIDEGKRFTTSTMTFEYEVFDNKKEKSVKKFKFGKTPESKKQARQDAYNFAKEQNEKYEEEKKKNKKVNESLQNLNENCSTDILLFLNSVVEDCCNEHDFNDLVEKVKTECPDVDMTEIMDKIKKYSEICNSENASSNECKTLREEIENSLPKAI